MLKLQLQLFGGRGAGSPEGDRPLGGGDGGGKDNFSNGLGTLTDVSMADALGKQGKPYSVTNALKNVNPNYSRRYSDYSENCQRCVIAYEMRRRGYDVTALPTYQGDILPYGTRDGYARWMGAFRGARAENVGATTSKKVQANLETKMKSWGAGSRGIVRIPGHVFNVENQGGRIIYVEAQTGQRYTNKDVFGRIKGANKLKSIQIVRVDNLRPSARITKSITNVKGLSKAEQDKLARTSERNRRKQALREKNGL